MPMIATYKAYHMGLVRVKVFNLHLATGMLVGACGFQDGNVLLTATASF